MVTEVLEPLRLLCQNGGGPGYGPGYCTGYGPYGWSHMMPPFGGGLLMLLLLALIFFLMFRFPGRHGNPEPRETALDILKKRYARGEIGLEDFERMKQNLKD